MNIHEFKTCVYPQYSVLIIDSKLIKVLIEETGLLLVLVFIATNNKGIE